MNKKFFILLVIGTIIFLGLGKQALADGNPVLSLNPVAYNSHVVGGSYQVKVNISNVVDFVALTSDINYDPNILSFDSVVPEGEFADPSATFIPYDITIPGIFTFYVDIFGLTPVNGESDIVSINFTVIGAGTSTISFSNTNLFSTDEELGYIEITSYDKNEATINIDVTSPVITLNGSSTIDLVFGDIYTELGATATDNIDGSLPVAITGTVSTSTIGTSTLIYSATDVAGNIGSTTRQIVVRDLTAPVITLNGSSTIYLEYSQDYTELGASSTDNYDGDISGGIIITGTVATTTLGTSTINYSSTDSSGNIATTSRQVVVRDTTKPTITLNGAATINLTVGDAYTELNASATDLHDGDLSGSIVKTGSVNASAAGTYAITYTVSDSSGNAADPVTRTVVVSNASSGGGGGGGGGGYSPVITTVVKTATSTSATSTVAASTATSTNSMITVVKGMDQPFGGYVSTYGNLKNLAGASSSVVEEVSSYEANEIFSNDSFINLDKTALALYEKIIKQAKTAPSQKTKYSIAYFIYKGTQTTKILGAGERAGVLNSYFSVYGRLPATIANWQDVIKIANGRWPQEKNITAENTTASKHFKKIYQRTANLANANDNAAVSVITYGLRPANRNLASEVAAIKIFKAIFKYNPTGAIDWDIVRAIAYSGAKR